MKIAWHDKILAGIILACVALVAAMLYGCQHAPVSPGTPAAPRPPSAELATVDASAKVCADSAVSIKAETAKARTEATVAAVIPRLAAVDTQADKITAAAARIDAAGDSATAQVEALKVWQTEVSKRELALQAAIQSANAETEKWKKEAQDKDNADLKKKLMYGVFGGIALMAVGIWLLTQGNTKLGYSLAGLGLPIAGCSWLFREHGDVIGWSCLAVAVIGVAAVAYLKRRALYEVVSGLESAKTVIPADALAKVREFLHAAQSPATEAEIAKLQAVNNNTAASITQPAEGTAP